MPTITINAPGWTACTLTTSDTIYFNDALILSLLSAVMAMNISVPLTKLEVTATTLPFDYVVKAQDNRTWKQKIYERAENPLMSFDTTDHWRPSETQLLRPIRDIVETLLATKGLTALLIKPA